MRSPSARDRPHRRAVPATNAPGPWSLIQADPDHATRNCRKRLVPRLWTRAMRWKRIARRRRGRKGAAAKRRRTLAKQVFLVVRRARHAFLQKRWPPTMRAVVRGLIGTALFRWFVGFSSTPKPCTVAFAILRNVPELARWTSRPLLEFGRGTFCSHVSGFPASHTAIVSTRSPFSRGPLGA